MDVKNFFDEMMMKLKYKKGNSSILSMEGITTRNRFKYLDELHFGCWY